ncbi:MYB and HSA domain-containing protein [Nannizzia gypsea CBS 118893]|uniref:MYB and HSA domain-containing protein n=1 Tax=Arthroderma gypseum (strain ATCC MYA-4604 / CBS 118893) TaxID=535722 RepID=E4UW73_ARTGP|nr:MYB and HSA domain-containing protein [Nannizzia gypsea CBS 118893]EFR01681.1 MYB and HSA domain-containing protein [Nannizzia gypsea CBS 118893]
MLSDGLLRSRHDEIARCLSSRKRKLSELYYATATFPHPSNAGGHREPLARQKEAAFLEANDLSKGRLYDEHTLPERPRLETVLAENEIKHGPPRADELDRPQAPASQPVPGITSHQLPAQGRPFADSTQPQLTVSSAGVQTTEQPETGQSVHLPHRQPNGVDTSHAQHASEAAAKPTSPKTTAQATTQTTAHPLSPAETNRTSSFNDRLGVAPIIVPPKVAEAASSPMSTGPSSSHTSATERSPASSSTESVASIAESPSVGKISTDEPASNAQSQPMSAVVPSTPDEQLQLEAAMSIRNSTTPKQPVTSHDKDGDQHMAEAPADLKESQLKREPTESVTNSRPSSSSGPQTAPDVKHATKAVESRRQPAEQQYPRPERMTTRVASGAIRHKSIVPETNKPAFKVQPDDVWKTQLLPVSKYAQGTIQFKEDGPPRKRSRYDYEQDTYHDGEEENAYRSLLPEQMDVALFSSEYKALRDRIHPGNAFRPPTEYIMPPLGFYESRQSSHWTLAEDDELRKLVQEYSFNWSLIASCLAPRSSFVSTSDRRTPWECFERWINLEGLPPDMAKTPYFRTYNARLEAAQRTIMNAQQQAIQQQQQQQQNGGQVNPGAQAMIRRRTAQPLRVERKRSSRHLALLAGMRKLSQKRETNLQKQQHATQLASMRKVNEATQPRPPISTPQEFSQLKHERELKFLEKQEQYRQQMIAHQRAAMAQRAAQLNPSGQFNGIPVRPPASVPNGAGGVQVPIANGLANGIPNGVGVSQSRPHPGMAAMPNGLPATGPIPVSGGMPMKMMPQQGLQQPISGRPGLPIQTSPDNSRIIREANRLQEQQRLLQSRQQQHQFHGGQQGFVPQQGPHSSPNMNATPATAGNNPALMAAFQTATNGGSPSFAASSLAPGMMPAASPRMNHPSTPLNNAPALPNLNNIQASLQRLHPTMSQEQISKLATERLQQYQQQQQRLSQAALNAAAGNLGVSNLPPNYQAGNSGQQIPQQGTVNGVPSVPLQNQTQGYMNRLGVSQANGQQNRPGVGIAPPRYDQHAHASKPKRNPTEPATC